MTYITPADLLAKYGSKAAIARRHGVCRPSVYSWFASGVVPELVQFRENYPQVEQPPTVTVDVAPAPLDNQPQPVA